MTNFDVFAVSPQGFEVHWQLQGEKVYEDAVKLLDKLQRDGFKARELGRPRTKPSQPVQDSQAPFCQEHGTSFKPYSKDGRSWFAHKLDNGKWCRQGT